MADRRILIGVFVGAVALCLAFSFVVYHDDAPVDKSFVILHTNDSHCHYADEDHVGFETVPH